MTAETTDLELAQPTDGHLSERMKYAQALAAADLLPTAYRRKPANILLAMEYGHALGLDTITAIQSVHVIEGKPSASAQLIGGLVRRAGHRLRVSGDDTHAVAEIVRRDDPEFVFRSEWTIARAQAAGLAGKGPWKSYPAAMLKARAITEVARDACPEALAGVAYTAEELGAQDLVQDLAQNPAPTSDPWGGAPASMPDATLPPIDTETGEIVDAEIVDEIPAPEPATKAQIGAIAAMLGKCGISDKQGRRDAVAKALGEDIESATDLSKEEASKVIDVLKALADADNPGAAFAKWYVA